MDLMAAEAFSISVGAKSFYRSDAHANALELLQYAIERREGFVVLTGEAGTGKTTLCRALIEGLDQKTFATLLPEPFLSEEDLLRAILQDLGVVSRGDESQGGRRPSTQELVNALHDFLRSLQPLDGHAVLVIDDAHRLTPRILEQIRILSNFETAQEKLLHILLVGRPDLLPLLRSPQLRQLDQRVSIRYQLKPLAEEEVAAYVAHRLALAASAARVFSPAALRVVHAYTGGNPRLINMLCERVLADGASASRIDEQLVVTAAEGLDLKPVVRSPRSILTRFFSRSRA
jgi:general secretion pathway protein A